MQLVPMAETGLFAAAAAILVAAAYGDLKARRISNRISIALVAVFAAVAGVELLAGAAFMASIGWPLIAAAILFAAGLGLFAAGTMGGGDVKLMAATALLAGAPYVLSFVLYVAIAGGLVAIATLVHARLTNLPKNEAQVPYGVAIAAGGLWVCFTRIAQLQG